MNIFLFTFILGWYTEFSIFDAKKGFSETFNDSINNLKSNSNSNSNLNQLDNALNKEANHNYVKKLEKDETKNLLKDILPEGIIIVKYIFYSFLIYVIFLLTTKCKLPFLLAFLVLMFISFVVFIIKTYSKTKDELKSSFEFFKFISRNEKTESIKEIIETNPAMSQLELRKKIRQVNTNYILTNIETILFIISLILLVIGFISYYIIKRSQYNKGFSMLTFIFGKYC
tara:strand:- start:522 stop:1205 length:684 start_codon:yes stop_codon:yes gene_type:complete